MQSKNNWDIEEWQKYQAWIADQVSLNNRLPPFHAIQTVAGADISFGRFSKTGFAVVIVLSYPKLEIIEESSCVQTLDYPYIPGYLAFREWPLVRSCLETLKTKPDVLLCDGQGIAHPRGAGLASHIGVESGLITIGCAKNRLVGEYGELGIERGSISDLLYQGKKIGEVLRTRRGIKPLFVSPGHQIDFLHASQLILELCRKYRQPEPIRAAHCYVNQLRVRDGSRDE